MQALPYHGSCFVCGDENPHSMGLTWYLNDDGSIYSEMIFTLAQQGPPSYVHGGASAAVLDEAMGAAVWRAGLSVAAVNLEINYHAPLPLGQKAIITARIAEKLQRKVLTSGEIRLQDGTLVVSGRGIYVEAPHLFEGASFGY